MLNLLSTFFGVFLSKIKPQDIPSNPYALKVAFVGAFITETLSVLGQESVFVASLLAAVKLAVFGGIIYLFLKLHHKSERWTQTATAVFGAQLITNLLTLPFISHLVSFMQAYRESIEQGSVDFALSPALIFVACLQIWFVVVIVRILREAMEISTLRAIMNTLLVIYLLTLVMSFIVNSLGSPALPTSP